MDFIVGLTTTSQKHDSIWVIVDRLTKTAHFIPVHTTYNAKKYAEIYLDRIVCLHDVPKMIISDRGTQFTARFWEQMQASLGTKLIRSSAYHPQTDGQTERINQIIEDMLRALFNRTEEPLDADAWIRTIESKFALLPVPFAILHVFGGTTTMACFRPITLLLGMNSKMHLRTSIFQGVSWKGN